MPYETGDVDDVFADIRRPSLQNEDIDIGIFGQAIRYCESGWPATEDDL